MHVAIVGSYPPRACGIATFTADVERSLLLDPRVDRVSIVAVGPPADRPAGSTIAELDPDDPRTDRTAAEALTRHGVDVVLVEHEFGLFRGPDGAGLLDFVAHVRVPIALTLHTVLPRFSAGQAQVLRELCRRASVVQVFTATARDLLLGQGLVDRAPVRVVPHGAPMELYAPTDPDRARAELGWSDRRIVSTFGLLSPGKGLASAVAAMSRVVDAVPEALYVIAGRTHPEVARRDGEAYRHELEAEVRRRGLDDHVAFCDRFLDMDELAQLLAATHVFCTPYVGEDQSVSGALTFALAAGLPVVSTPYRYAQDVLTGDAGLLVPFGDERALGDAVVRLLADGPARRAAQAAARQVGASMSWPAIGRETATVLAEAVARPPAVVRLALVPPSLPVPQLPREVSQRHLELLIDDTGILQHADGEIPRHEFGYCVDDVARLLPVSQECAVTDPAWHNVTRRALAYLRAAEVGGGGRMRNFCGWDRHWLDEPHHGDHVGRALWGLGELLAADDAAGEAVERLARSLALGFVDSPRWVMNDAYAVLGLAAWGTGCPDEAGAVLVTLVEGLLARWNEGAAPGWQWFEPRLTYDIARPAEALIRGGSAIGSVEAVSAGLQALAWLDQQCLTEQGWYRFPGHRGLGVHDRLEDSGDEQPLEAAAFVDAHAAAFTVTGDPSHLDLLDRAAAWFIGHNRLGLPLASVRTGACCDGLTEDGTNRNRGAESTLSFQRAVMVRRRHVAPPALRLAPCAPVTVGALTAR